MLDFNRRTFLKTLSAAAGVSLISISKARASSPKARVIVVGGGYGGASAAKYLRLMDPGIEVTLFEKNKSYISCPLSNEVLSGDREMVTLERGYDGLVKRGVKVVHSEVTRIDPVAKKLAIAEGEVFDYDYLIVSPGIEFDFSAIRNFTPELAETKITHAWKAGSQTLLLKKQLEAMPDGGKFLISVPKGPFRCPPGPYERAAQAAMLFHKQGKKKSKIIILDANDTFSKRPLFEEAWKALYGYGPEGMIEWVAGNKDGKIEEIDPDAMTCSGTFEQYQGDVINIIPPHRAGKIALDLGLANFKGTWCGVNPNNMESTAQKDIFVIGDSCVGGDVEGGNAFPKSAHMANSQAKVAVASIVATVNGQAQPNPIYTNTCYSVVGHEWGFSVVHLFRVENNKWVYVKEGSGISPVSFGTKEAPIPVPRFYRKLEVEYADGWLRNLLADAFA